MKFIALFLVFTLLLVVVIAAIGYSSSEYVKDTTTEAEHNTTSYKKYYSTLKITLKTGLVVIGSFIHEFRDEIVAVGTAFIALFTIILGGATIFLYFATRDLVEGAEKTAQYQLRAYVFVKDAFIRNLDGPGFPTVHIYVKNYGQTPAYKYRTFGAVKYGTFPQNEFVRNPDGDQRILITTLAPGAELAAAVIDIPIIITQEIKDNLKNGKLAIWAFGQIAYVDVFEKPRGVNFRFIFGGDVGTRMFDREGVRLGAMGQTIEGNSSIEGEE